MKSRNIQQEIIKRIKEGKVKWKKGVDFATLSNPASMDKFENPRFKSVELGSVWQKGFIIEWGAYGIGCGELTFRVDRKGKLEMDTECMGKEFAKKILLAFVDSAHPWKTGTIK